MSVPLYDENVSEPIAYPQRVRTLTDDGETLSWTDTKIFEASPVHEGLFLSIEDGQRIVDSLWNLGVRPSEAVGSAGALTAAKDHLADLRKSHEALLAMHSPERPEASDAAMELLRDANDMLRQINGFAREQANADAGRWRSLSERLTHIEGELENEEDSRNLHNRVRDLDHNMMSSMIEILRRLNPPEQPCE
jgi:hypothetical protein